MHLKLNQQQKLTAIIYSNIKSTTKTKKRANIKNSNENNLVDEMR